MTVPARLLYEEIRQQEQRLRRIAARRIESNMSAYSSHPVFRKGDGERLAKLASVLVPFGGGFLQVLGAHRQVAAEMQRSGQQLGEQDTVSWLSELQGTVNRTPDPLPDAAAAAVRGTLSYIRTQIDLLEQGKR